MEMSAIFPSLKSMKVFLESYMMLESRRKLLRVKLLFNLVESYVGLKSYFFFTLKGVKSSALKVIHKRTWLLFACCIQ